MTPPKPVSTEGQYASQYAFVTTTSNPMDRPDSDTRTLIRRHAMQRAGIERRRHHSYGQHNLRQFPVYEGATAVFRQRSIAAAPAKPESTRSEQQRDADAVVDMENMDVDDDYNDPGPQPLSTTSTAVNSTILRDLARSDYSCLQVTDTFSLLNLSALTTLVLGHANKASFVLGGSSIADVFRRTTSSFLNYLPSRYGKIQELTDATECLIARLKCNLPGTTILDQDNMSRIYLKALQSLQQALSNENSSKSAETLCSVMLLRLYELMGNNETQSEEASQHVIGAAQIIQYRGPDAFESDFERELLTANAGPIVMSCLMNNQTCFLAEPRWVEVFKRAIRTDKSACVQSGLASELWETLVVGPNLFQAVTYIICSGQPSTEQERQQLIQHIQLFRIGLLDWYASFQAKLSSPRGSPPPSTVNENVKLCAGAFRRHEVYATYLSCLILKNRLLYALSPQEFHNLEAEAQALSDEILDLESRGRVGHDSLQEGLFRVQTVWNAKATQRTRELWQSCQEQDLGETGVIGRDLFVEWCQELGRKVT
jgi:hypothetical protein